MTTNPIVTLISFSWCVDVILHSVLFCHDVVRPSIYYIVIVIVLAILGQVIR